MILLPISLEHGGILCIHLEQDRAVCVALGLSVLDRLVTIAANGTIQLANPGSDGLQGLQALTMTTAASAQQGTTILQYAQTSDGQQILVPSNQVVVQGAGGEMQTYQIHTPAQSSLGQTVVMSSPVSMSSHTKSDDPTMKREIRLAKN
ncbi:unnamed protein product, partial [Arctogadus glacialis]